MTIEEIIKEAFSRGWNASHECATDFDYDCALNGFLSEVETEVKKFRIGAVMPSLPNGKGVLAALKELSDCFTDEERKTMFGNEV